MPEINFQVPESNYQVTLNHYNYMTIGHPTDVDHPMVPNKHIDEGQPTDVGQPIDVGHLKGLHITQNHRHRAAHGQ